MDRQRIILIAGVMLGGSYGWLTGAFDGLLSWGSSSAVVSPAPLAEGDGGLLVTATFAAGCFWCVESDFDAVPGVVSTTSGYTGGRVPNPRYGQVSSGSTGHAEAVEVRFDPRRVTYEQLLARYWRNVDPFESRRQFCDVGAQYRPAIFTHSDDQATTAVASRARIEARLGRRVVVAIQPAGPFYRAEAYHQDYSRTHSLQYRYYRWRCGRDARLEKIWGSPPKAG